MNWDWVWAAFIVIALAMFFPLEIIGTRDGRGKNYGTLSATLRRWLGIDPPAGRRWIAGGLFAAALVVFGIHILTPWL